ncbi:hypothetical protein Bca101_072349 [Brassica carinata]
MVKPTSKDPPFLGESSSLNTTKRKRGRPLGVRNKVKAPSAGIVSQHFAPQFFDSHLRPHKIGNSAELKEKNMQPKITTIGTTPSDRNQ